MRALVVYDSLHGNTERVAQAIGEALGAPEDVQVRRADVQPGSLAELNLLVVCTRTHGGQPSKATVSFLDSVPAGGLQGVRVAAFGTHTPDSDPGMSFVVRSLTRLFGQVAPRLAKRLEDKGGARAAPPEGFIVEGMEGPLREGEVERAAAWARQLVAGAEAPQ